MAEPDLTMEDPPDAPDAPADDEEEPDVEMVTTDVETTGADPDGFFEGVETSAEAGDDVADDLFDGIEEGAGGSESDESSGSSTASKDSSQLAADINRGVARAAVIGLDDEWATDTGELKTKEGLQSEFEETFEAFRLGYYAEECAQKYFEMDDDIPPGWGLLGASLICAAVVLHKRPDGDEYIRAAQQRISETSLGNLSSMTDRAAATATDDEPTDEATKTETDTEEDS